MAVGLDPDGSTSGFALSRYIAWPVGPTVDRGLIDMNFGYEDGAVQRLRDVGHADPLNAAGRDERMVPVPRYNTLPYAAGVVDGEWQAAPRE